MKRLLPILIIALLLGTVLLASPCKSQQSKPTTLMFGHMDSPTTGIVGVLTEMAQEVDKLTRGTLKLELHQHAELGFKGPEMLRIFSSGTLAAGEMLGSYVMGEERLFGMANLPFLMTPKDIVPAINVLRPFIEKKLDEHNMKLLLCAMYPNMLWNKFEVNSKEDVKRLRIRGHQPDVVAVARLGGTAVTMPATEVYQALATGMLTGAPWGIDGAVGFGFHEQTKFLYRSPIFGAVPTYFVINKNALNALSKDIQKVLFDTAKKYEPKVIDIVLYSTPKTIEKVKAAGVTIYDSMKPELVDWMRETGGRPSWNQWAVDYPQTKSALDALLAVIGRQ